METLLKLQHVIGKVARWPDLHGPADYMLRSLTPTGYPKGLIFNIQGYSIHDGPGIRSTVFMSAIDVQKTR